MQNTIIFLVVMQLFEEEIPYYKTILQFSDK